MKEKLDFMYKETTSHMNILLCYIENNKSIYIRSQIKRVLLDSAKLEGYAECLLDCGCISKSVADMIFNFTEQVRHDIENIEVIYYGVYPRKLDARR